MTFTPPVCECGHLAADHKSGRSSGPFPPVYGVCFRCGCVRFREVDPPEEDEAA